MRIERRHLIWACTLLSLCSVALGCARATRLAPESKGQTHWLSACDSDEECGELSCMCQRCVEACAVDSQCSALPGAQCVKGNFDVEDVICAPHTSLEAIGVCLATCSKSGECPFDQECVLGLCAPPRADAGAPPELASNDAAMIDVGDDRVVDAGVTIAWDGGDSRPPISDTDELVLFWNIYDGDQQYELARASIEGRITTRLRLVLDAPPADAARYPIEDPETGVQTDPNAPRVAGAYLRTVVAGKLESDPSAVNTLDVDTITGQVPGAWLFWTPIALDSTAGVRGFDPNMPRGPFAAGYHLFIHGEEVPLGTALEVGVTIGD